MYYRYAAWLLQVLIFVLTLHDPFFGDAISTVSRAAVHIYNQNLGTVWYLPVHDPGHPTLFPYLLAVCWKIAGKHLWVAHLLTLLFALGVTTQLHGLAIKTVGGTTAHRVLLLAVVQPTFVAQSAMVLTHLPLAFFFLWALNNLYPQHRVKSFWAASIFMMLTHLEGAFLLAGTAASCFLIQLKTADLKLAVKQTAVLFAPAFLVLLIWGLAHARHTGWWFSSPVYADHRSWMGVLPMIKSVGLIAWRMVDYGNIVFYVIIGWAVAARKLYRHPLFMYVAGAFISCLLVFSVLMSKSIAHRYFLPVHLPAMVLLLLAVNEFRAKRGTLLLLLSLVTLMAGNFLYYPGKCIGDATIAYRNYFFIAKQLNAELPDSVVLYTYAPLSNNDSVTTLSEFQFLNTKEIYPRHVNQLPVVLQSNCNCDFTPGELNELGGWKGKSYERGAVYANVLFNPLLYPVPLLNESLRKKTGAELWMEQLKSNLKK
ncbi:MAG: glycosyltransferase family 39 protein [Bacteroidia bacterium]|nr:glycosyltransferase family 39 protein [Bacteroidia bacterium]